MVRFHDWRAYCSDPGEEVVGCGFVGDFEGFDEDDVGVGALDAFVKTFPA